MNWRNIELDRAASGIGLTGGMIIGMFADKIVVWVGAHPYLSVIIVWYACVVIAFAKAVWERFHE